MSGESVKEFEIEKEVCTIEQAIKINEYIQGAFESEYVFFSNYTGFTKITRDTLAVDNEIRNVPAFTAKELAACLINLLKQGKVEVRDLNFEDQND